MTNYSPIRLIVLLGAIALLHACVTPTGKLPAQREASVEAAEQAEQKGEYIVAAREYAELTKTAPASKRTSFQLRYAEVLIRAGQIEDAKRALKEITVPRNDRSGQAHLYMVNALLASFEGAYKNAIRLLNKAVSVKNIDPILRTRIYLVMTETELALNNPIGAARNLIVREKYLVDPESIDRNQLKLWEILSAMKPSELNQALNLTRDAKLRGWLELAIANSKGRKELSKTIKSWPETHPTHPATKTTLATLAGARFKKIGYVSRAALLLPLSSEKYGYASKAVEEGVRVMEAADTRRDKPVLKIYDIGDNPDDADKFYKKAVEDDAQLIIGPLGLEAVNEIVKNADLDVPTLLLGRSDDDVDNGGTAVFQFGLTPEEEAKQAAERAYLDGHRTAAVLYPETNLGERLLKAFSDHWLRLGGIIVSTAMYESGQHDYGDSVKQLLSISDSEARKQMLEKTIKKRLAFWPRRRQDVDCVFLAADAKHGRLIKPQLNYHRAAKIPVYSTSHIFTGKRDPIKDADLDGIMFGDMPWMLVEDGDIYQLRTRQGNWPYAYSQLDRLYALGMDSYAVIPYLGKISSDTSLRFNGVTSGLSIGNDGQMHRQLLWARFRSGVPKLLDNNYKYSGQIN